MSKLFNEVYKLKNLRRRGWLVRGIDKVVERTESDAEHIYSSIMLAYEIITKECLNLDTYKIIKMLMFHELGEVDCGDFTPFDAVSKEEKYKLERRGVKRISKATEINEILELWEEFEKGESEEAKFVKQIDKLDSIMQAKIYSEKMKDLRLYKEFYDYHSPNIDSRFLKYIED